MLFSVGPQGSPFNLNLGFGVPCANLIPWSHQNPASLDWPVDKSREAGGRGLCALGQGQAGLEAGLADSKRVAKWLSWPSGLGVRWASIPPLSFFTSFIQSVPACLVPPGPISLFLLSIPFFFPFFIFLPLALLPFHPLSLPAPPPQLLWQQLSARNKGRIQLGHQFPKQHPRVERGKVGGSRPAQQGRPPGIP